MLTFSLFLDVSALIRLSRSFDTFDQHWTNVFQAIVSALTWEVESKTNMGNIENDLAAFEVNEGNRHTHPFQLNGASVAVISARILTEHRRLVNMCHRARLHGRAPDERQCVENLLLCLPDRIFREIGKINAHNDVDPASDYQEWYKVAQQAEKRLDHQPPLYTKIEKMRNNSRSKPSEKAPGCQ